MKVKSWHFIVLGLFLLFFMGRAEAAGVCLLIGIVMLFERIWPEKWGTEKVSGKE